MEKKSLQWRTSDGLRIKGSYWPVEQPRAVLNVVHGMGEHIQRYDHVAAFYQAAGIAVAGNDHRGHGTSEGKRGHIPSFELLLDEVDELLHESSKLYPDVPHFLFGQSLGGNLVLNYSLQRDPEISGVIASSPWIQLAFRPDPITVWAGKMMRKLMPTFTQSTKLKAEHLSTDQEVAKTYQADPLVHDRVTAAMGTAMLEAADYLHHYSGPFPLPLLLLHGTADQIVSFDAAHQFAERVSGSVTFVPWEGLYHELHNEIRRQEVLNTTLKWIEDHLNT